MPVFEKPSGAQIEINDKSVDHAKSLGWKEVKPTKKKAKAKTK